MHFPGGFTHVILYCLSIQNSNTHSWYNNLFHTRDQWFPSLKNHHFSVQLSHSVTKAGSSVWFEIKKKLHCCHVWILWMNFVSEYFSLSITVISWLFPGPGSVCYWGPQYSKVRITVMVYFSSDDKQKAQNMESGFPGSWRSPDREMFRK